MNVVVVAAIRSLFMLQTAQVHEHYEKKKNLHKQEGTIFNECILLQIPQ